jgi:hypothetical protein
MTESSICITATGFAGYATTVRVPQLPQRATAFLICSPAWLSLNQGCGLGERRYT